MATYDFKTLSPYRYVSTSGVVIPDTSKIQDGVVEMFKSVFGQDIDVTPETIIGRLVEAFTVFLRDTVGITAQNSCQFNLNVATGIYLDAIGALFKVSRNSSSRSSVIVTLTGTQGTVIPGGTVFATSDGDAFYLEQDMTLPSDSENAEAETSATGTALSMNYGPVKCLANGMISIVSPLNGLSSVSNSQEAALGTLGESDDSYRRRILNAIGGFGGMVPSVYKELYDATYTDGGTTKKSVRHALVLNNGDGIAATKKNVTLAPHSIFVCVDAPSDYDNKWKTSVANAIAKSKSLGCGMTRIQGSVTASAGDSLGGITTYFYIAQPRKIAVVSTWGNGITSSQIDGYAETLEEIISGFGIGATITSEQVLSSLALKYPTLRVLSVTLDGGTSVVLDGNQIGTVAS